MTVTVCFFTPQGIGSVAAPGVGHVRIREDITIPGTTTAAAVPGELVMVCNGEADTVAVALGLTPDGNATAANEKTSAGFPVAAGSVSMPFTTRVGDKVSVKAIS